MNNNIGLAVITCQRAHYFQQCIKAIQQNKRDLTTIVVVNDGPAYDKSMFPEFVDHVIQNNVCKTVSVVKNQGLRALKQINYEKHGGCKHLFLIEDDIIIKSPDVFKAYIKAAEESGVWHMNYALHGPANKQQNNYNQPNPRQIVDYDNTSLALYPNSVGAFSYYYDGVIKNVGYFDERFQNSFDHVEHTYRVIQKGLHPPYWWFADLANSNNYLSEISDSIKNSSIKRTKEWQERYKKAFYTFMMKHHYNPLSVPDTSLQEVQQIMQSLQDRYAKKVLND